MKQCRYPNCSIEKCVGRGLCHKHYNLLRAHGLLPESLEAEVIAPPRAKKGSRGKNCAVSQCPKPHHKLGYCTMHYQRLLKYGPGQVAMPRVRERPYTAPAGSSGYVNIYLADGRVMGEHRYVMECILGRPLVEGENVHHKNGDKSDNRPENLELWTKAQPPGQRVFDKIVWAKQLLAQYGDDENKYAV